MLTSHPSPDALDRYRRGLLTVEELLTVDDHLAACAACRETALRAAPTPAAGAGGLDTLLGGRVDEHPGFEELAAHVDGTQDDVAREVTEMHLADCSLCREEVADLRGFKARLGDAGPALEEQNQQPVLPPSFGDEASGRHAFQVGQHEAAQATGFGAGARGRRRWWLGLALPAAAVIIWMLIPRGAVRQITPPPIDRPTARVDPGGTPGAGEPPSAPAAVATLRDGGAVVTLDAAGQVTGLPESLPRVERTMLVAALSTGRLPLPELVRDLGAEGEVLRGGTGGASLPFTLREPLGTAVESDRPRFRWARLASARAYVVTLYDEDFARVARSPELTSPEWTCDRPLARGKTYTWQVTALTAPGDAASSTPGAVTVPAAPAPPARFVVLAAPQASELARTREAHADAHLVMALAYARAGVRDAAERELRALQRDNPDAAVVRALLASLR